MMCAIRLTVNFHIVTMEHHLCLPVCRILLFHWTNYFRCLCRLPMATPKCARVHFLTATPNSTSAGPRPNTSLCRRFCVVVSVSTALCTMLYALRSMYYTLYVNCSMLYVYCTMLYVNCSMLYVVSFVPRPTGPP